jgi:Proteasome assembly chaperone 4
MLGFVSSYILDESVEVEILGVVCGGMKDSTSNSLGQRSPKDNSCFISSLVSHPDTIFTVCNSEVQVEHSFSWAAQVCYCDKISYC